MAGCVTVPDAGPRADRQAALNRFAMSESDFTLDPRLAADTAEVGDLALCRVLLMDDARFPWLILVPRRPDVSEIIDLSEADAALLWQEVRLATGVMQALSKPDKVNVGALGNVVAQLHVHVVGRFPLRSGLARPGLGLRGA